MHRLQIALLLLTATTGADCAGGHLHNNEATMPGRVPALPILKSRSFDLEAIPLPPTISSGPVSVWQRSLSTQSLDRILWSKDGTLFVTSTAHTVAIGDAKTGQMREALDITSQGLVFSEDGAQLAILPFKGGPVVWSMQTGAWRRLASTEESLSDNCAFLLGDRRFAATTDVGVTLWDVESGAIVAKYVDTRTSKNLHHTISARGDLIALAHEEALELIDATSGVRRHLIDGVTLGEPLHVVLSPDGRRLALISRDEKVRWIDAKGGQVLAISDPLGQEPSLLAWHPLNQQVVVSSDFRLWLWDGKGPLVLLPSPRGQVKSVAFSASGDRLSVGSHWGITSIGLAKNRKLHEQPAGTLSAPSPDGRRALIVDGTESPATMISLEQEQVLYVLPHERDGYLSSSSINPDKQVLIDDIPVDVAAGKLVARTRGAKEVSVIKEANLERSNSKPVRLDIPGYRPASDISPDGRWVVAFGHELKCQWGSHPMLRGCVCLYDLRERHCHKMFDNIHESGGLSGEVSWQWSPDGKLLARQHPFQEEVLLLFDPSTARPIDSVAMGNNNRFAWLNEQVLLFYSFTPSLRLFRLKDRAVLDLHLRPLPIPEAKATTRNRRVRERKEQQFGLIALRPDGRWDGDAELLPFITLRQSPSLTSPMQAIGEVAQRLHIPGLYAAFLAGKP